MMIAVMKWENLREFKCPYCSADLEAGLAEIKCKACKFHITEDRFRSISENRKQRPTNLIKIRWQNLMEGRCPICAAFLTPNPSGRMLYNKCVNFDCTFKITDQRMAEILEDETHPAHIFYKEHHE